MSHPLSSAATVKTDDTLNTHVFSFILKLCAAFTGHFCVQNNENYMVFSSDIASVFALCLTLKYKSFFVVPTWPGKIHKLSCQFKE